MKAPDTLRLPEPRGLRIPSLIRTTMVAAWALLGAGMVGCGSEEPTAPPVDVDPSGDTVLLRGEFQAQDALLTEGCAAIVEDKTGQVFLTLSNDFKTELQAGTVHVYMAKTEHNLAEQRDADPDNISSMIGRIDDNGAHRFPITDETKTSLYPYVILWCEPEGINFAACRLAEVN